MGVKTRDLDKEEYRQLRNTMYTFFYYSNKPTAVPELCLQFKTQKKVHIEKILDDLVSKNKIFLKLCGRTKVYCLSQNMEYEIDDPNYTDEVDQAQDQAEEDKVLRFLKWRNAAVTSELKALKDLNRDLDAEILSLDTEMSVEELKKAIKTMNKAVEENGAYETAEYVDYEEFDGRKKQLVLMEKEYSCRKKVFKEIVSGVSEGLEMKPKDLLEEAGIEEGEKAGHLV